MKSTKSWPDLVREFKSEQAASENVSPLSGRWSWPKTAKKGLAHGWRISARPKASPTGTPTTST